MKIVTVLLFTHFTHEEEATTAELELDATNVLQPHGNKLFMKTSARIPARQGKISSAPDVIKTSGNKKGEYRHSHRHEGKAGAWKRKSRNVGTGKQAKKEAYLIRCHSVNRDPFSSASAPSLFEQEEVGCSFCVSVGDDRKIKSPQNQIFR